jgi:tetratricopeptide (TPR) repeat protein
VSSETIPTLEQLKSLLREGIFLAQQRDWAEAYATLGQVLDGYRSRGEKIPALALSYYALASGMHTKKFKQAIEFCQSALGTEPGRVDHYANLGMLYMACGFRRKAVEMVAKGLELDSSDSRLLQLKHTLGWRRPPVISSLSRDHWLNVFLGKLRHALKPPKMEVAAVRRPGRSSRRPA